MDSVYAKDQEHATGAPDGDHAPSKVSGTVLRIGATIGAAVALICGTPLLMDEDGPFYNVGEYAASSLSYSDTPQVESRGADQDTIEDNAAVSSITAMYDDMDHDPGVEMAVSEGAGAVVKKSDENPQGTSLHDPLVSAGIIGNIVTESQVDRSVIGQEQDTTPTIIESEGFMVSVLVLVLLVAGFGIVFTIRKNGSLHATSKDHSDDGLGTDRDAVIAKWQEFSDRHEAIKQKVYDSTLDWDTVFLYPAINDMTVLQTRQLYEALEAARNAAVPAPSNVQLTDDIANLPYPSSVIHLERAWDTAWNYAQEVKHLYLSKAERQTIQQIRHLLDRLEYGGTTDHEQGVVYSRIEKLLGELTRVRVPEPAMRQIEQRTMLALDQTPHHRGVSLSTVMDDLPVR